ncbi:MAG: ABC transporter ATP-binding protein [Nocardioidaceae bacterium]
MARNRPGHDAAPGIDIDHLCVVRGRRTVIPDLTTHIRAGLVTGLLGPSGCGKTTLMRAIVGVQIVKAGTLMVGGRPAGSADLRRRVGYVTQRPSVYPDLTVRENLRFFAHVLGQGADVIGATLEIVDLTANADDRTGNLSGGQLSRVSLAVAMLARPQVLVLDEPTVGLDPVLRRQLWRTFHDLADAGTTLLVSSHVMDEAARCDRLLLMREGTLIADEGLASLLAATRTTDVESAFLSLVEAQGEAAS